MVCSALQLKAAAFPPRLDNLTYLMLMAHVSVAVAATATVIARSQLRITRLTTQQKVHTTTCVPAGTLLECGPLPRLYAINSNTVHADRLTGAVKCVDASPLPAQHPFEPTREAFGPRQPVTGRRLSIAFSDRAHAPSYSSA